MPKSKTASVNPRNPIAEIVEILSQKWVMRILWELRDEPLTFRGLQQACGDLSPTVLNQRLKCLEAAGLVEKLAPSGYVLTPIAQELSELYVPLKAWTKRWQRCRG